MHMNGFLSVLVYLGTPLEWQTKLVYFLCFCFIDEEHWKKVLQANEKSGFYNNAHKCRKNSGFGSFRRRLCKHSPDADDTRDVAPSFARRVYCWFNHKLESNNNQISSNESPVQNDTDQLDPLHTGHVFSNTSQNKSVVIADEEENYVYIKHRSRDQGDGRNNGNTIYLSTNTPSFTLTECGSQERLKSPGDTSDRRLPLTSTKSCPSRRQSACKQNVVHFHWTWPLTRKRRSVDKYESKYILTCIANNSELSAWPFISIVIITSTFMFILLVH